VTIIPAFSLHSIIFFIGNVGQKITITGRRSRNCVQIICTTHMNISNISNRLLFNRFKSRFLCFFQRISEGPVYFFGVLAFILFHVQFYWLL